MNGPLLAVLGWIVFGALAFGLRSLLQLLRTGSTGFRGLGGGLRERAAGAGFGLGVHGAAYRAYAARVGRFFPGLGHRLWDPGRDGR